jgi:peptide deformylase
MALLTILRYPDPRLHTVAQPVAEVNDQIRQLVEDLAETMYAAPGIGLAATQVDVHKRVLVLDISDTHDQLLALINPELLEASGEAECEEGCLSVPGVYEKVTRAERIKIRALDVRGQGFTFDATGLLAVCIQHEMDHLEGKVFVEYLSRLKQDRVLSKIKKQQRLAARAM